MTQNINGIDRFRETSENGFRIFPGQERYSPAVTQKKHNPLTVVNKNDFAIMPMSNEQPPIEEVQNEVDLDSNLVEQFCSLALAFPVHKHRFMSLLDTLTNIQIEAALHSTRFRDSILEQILEKSNVSSENVLDFIAVHRGVNIEA